MPNFYAKTPSCLRCWEVSENSVTRKNPNGRHISLDSEPQCMYCMPICYVQGVPQHWTPEILARTRPLMKFSNSGVQFMFIKGLGLGQISRCPVMWDALYIVMDLPEEEHRVLVGLHLLLDRLPVLDGLLEVPGMATISWGWKYRVFFFTGPPKKV